MNLHYFPKSVSSLPSNSIQNKFVSGLQSVIGSFDNKPSLYAENIQLGFSQPSLGGAAFPTREFETISFNSEADEIPVTSQRRKSKKSSSKTVRKPRKVVAKKSKNKSKKTAAKTKPKKSRKAPLIPNSLL